MNIRSSRISTSKLDISKKDTLVFIGVSVTLGLIILIGLWKYLGIDLFPSTINVVETSGDSIQIAQSARNVQAQDVGPSSATISWDLYSDSSVEIQYGAQQDKLFGKISVPSGTKSWTLTNLFPRTRYFFRLAVGETGQTPTVSETFSFLTTR